MKKFPKSYSTGTNGKGSESRVQDIEAYHRNYEEIFGKKVVDKVLSKYTKAIEAKNNTTGVG